MIKGYVDERTIRHDLPLKVYIDQRIIVNKRRKRITLLETTLDGKNLHRWLCDTREKAIRDALTELGWKPPIGG